MAKETLDQASLELIAQQIRREHCESYYKLVQDARTQLLRAQAEYDEQLQLAHLEFKKQIASDFEDWLVANS